MADVVCCSFCGRDTRSKSGICRRCTQGTWKHTLTDKQIAYDKKRDQLHGRDAEIENEIRDSMRDATE